MSLHASPSLTESSPAAQVPGTSVAGEDGGLEDLEGADQTQIETRSASSEASRASRSGTGHIPAEASPRIGRFVVLETLGSGAMGVIYAAYDSGLDRKIALKLLKPTARGQEAREIRLVREAQSLAKLSHPNVVQVYEVGIHAGQVFVAMEFLRGSTLTGWLESERSQASVLEVFTQAGRGLEAAHRAGIVHRDFKPDNVFIEVEGRARVLDFGLARAEQRASSRVAPPTENPDDAGEEELASEELVTFVNSDVMDEGPEPAAQAGARRSEQDSAVVSLGSTRRESGDLTATGAFMGTPAYMSPEQFEGKTADSRSDQFSFCVALWEALYGERPFKGGSVLALSEAVRAGRLREPRSEASVPPRLHRVMVRGLAVDPDARWPDMGSLLAALTSDPARRKRRAILGVSLFAAASLAAALAFSMGQRKSAGAVCTQPERSVSAAWDDGARQGVSEAFASTGVGYAEDTFARVEAGLDDYAKRWDEQWADACRATHVHGDQSEHLLDMRMACLESRRETVTVFIGALASADATAVQNATNVISQLPSVESCADRRRLLELGPPPADPEMANEVARLRIELDGVRTIGALGRYDEALTRVKELDRRATTSGHAPIIAAVSLQKSRLELNIDEVEAAELDATRAFEHAVEGNDLRLAAEAAAWAGHVVGYARQRFEAGIVWARVGEAMAVRFGKDSVVYADARASTATVYFRHAHYEAAREAVLEVKGIREANLAADDPVHTSTLNDLSAITYSMGNRDEAVALQRRAIALREQIHGPNHPELVPSLQNLAVMLGGTREQSRPLHERAYAISMAAHGEDHVSVAIQLCALGRFDRLDGDFAAADQKISRALAIISDPRDLDRAIPLTYAGHIDEDRGDCEAGRAHFEEARGVVESSVGADHPRMLPPLAGLARCTLGSDPAAAKALFEQGLAIGEAHDQSPGTLADLRFGLARAEQLDGQEARARNIAARARTEYMSAGADEGLAELDEWLRSL
jgi:serine/threonine protein kinase/tetratricopeptide (TPR) repeat protein